MMLAGDGDVASLPGSVDVDGDSQGPDSEDDADSLWSPDDMPIELPEPVTEVVTLSASLALPPELSHIDMSPEAHEVAEFYSAPRVTPLARRLGLTGSFAFDVLT